MSAEENKKHEDSAPQNFFLRCPKCSWAKLSSGLTSDLVDLVNVKTTCKGCGKFRKYKCPKCGTSCPLKRIKGNS